MRKFITVFSLILFAFAVQAQDEKPWHSYAGIFSNLHSDGDLTYKYRGGLQYNSLFNIPSLHVRDASFDGRVWINDGKVLFFASIMDKYKISEGSYINVEVGKMFGPIFSKYVGNILSSSGHDAFPSTSVQSPSGYGGKICYEDGELVSHLSFLHIRGHYELSALTSFQDEEVEITIGFSSVLYQKDWSLILSGFNPEVANVTISAGYRTSEFDNEVGSSFFTLNINRNVGERFSPYLDVLSQNNTSILELGCAYKFPIWKANMRITGYSLFEENEVSKDFVLGLKVHLYLDIDFWI